MDISRFLEIEKKYALYEQRINNVNYWNYSRVQIWNFEIGAQKLGLQETHPTKKLSFFEKLKLAGGLLKNFMWRGKIFSNIDILFLAHERRTKIEGKYKCIYTEPLARMYPDSMTLDMPYEYRHIRPESDERRYYIDYILIIGNLYYQIHKLLKTGHYKKTLSLVKKQMEQPLKEILDSYQVSLPLEKFYMILLKKLLVVECERKLYDRLLIKVKPKIIVEVVYYGMHGMMLNELAKKHGIPTVELQHGAMYKDHAAYQFNWDNTIPQMPDKVFLFSYFWKERIRLPINKDSLVVTGFSYFEENRNRYIKNRTYQNRKTILFISQGTIGHMLSQLAVEVADVLLPEYRIIYKLHPAEASIWKTRYPYLKDSGIEVVGNESKDIYEYFAISDIQVGVYSTAIYEGLGFGLRTFIYNQANALYELVHAGYAQIVNNSCELAKLVREERELKSGDLFWSEHALDKMKTELNKQLEQI